MERLYHLIYPMRVCLITSRHEGKDNIMAASWVFPLSMDPPLFGVSVAKKRHSYEMIKNGRAFGINLPDPKLQDPTVLCGSESGRGIDKFEKAGFTKDEGKHVALIKECPVSIECELKDEIETGDHVLFVGKAIDVRKRSEAKGLYQVRGMEFTSL